MEETEFERLLGLPKGGIIAFLKKNWKNESMRKNNSFRCANCETEIHESEKFRLRGSLIIMRHGLTNMNKRHIVIGSVDDPLCKLGREQSKSKAKELKSAGEYFDCIVSSPLSRAIETANIIGAVIGAAVVIDARLRERCVGIYEGKQEFPGSLKFFLSEILIKKAESIESLRERTKIILNDAQKHGDARLLFVTHALPFLMFMRHIKGWNLKEMIAYDLPRNCETVKFRFCNPCFRCGNEFAEAAAQ